MMCGFIKRICTTFTDVQALQCLYISLVRSQLEYCSVIWNPWQCTFIDKRLNPPSHVSGKVPGCASDFRPGWLELVCSIGGGGVEFDLVPKVPVLLIFLKIADLVTDVAA